MFRSFGFHIQEDNSQREDRTQRHQRKFILSENKPVLPSLCTGFFLLAVMLPAFTILLEAFSAGYQVSASMKLFLRNSSWSAFITWLIFGIPEIFLCILQLIRIRYRGYKEYDYYFDDQIPVNVRPEDLKRIDSPRGPDRDSDLTLYLKEKGDGTRKKYKTFLLITAFAGTAAAAYFCLWICLWGRFLN